MKSLCQSIYKQNPQLNKVENGVTISLIKLLGAEGLALYHAALEEEANDPRFRKAVFCGSASYFEGDEWQERPVVIVSGPSGCGKSYAAKAAVEKTIQFLPKKISTNPTGNHVIAADGGDIRKASQIRKLMIREANSRGYTGVSDLHSNSKALEPIKKNVREAALHSSKLGVVIPETFSSWAVPNNSAKKMMGAIEKLPNTRLVFTRVKGASASKFRKIVAFMGSRRAWKTDFSQDEPSYYGLNSTENMSESKKYGGSGFLFGEDGSLRAEKWFMKNSKEKLSMIITMDLILVKPLELEHPDGAWVDADQHDPGTIKVPQRTLDDWNNLSNDQRTQAKSLETYYQNNQSKYGALIKSSVELELEIVLQNVKTLVVLKGFESQKGAMLQELHSQLESIKPISSQSVENLTVVRKELKIIQNQVLEHDRGFFNFETRTQKVVKSSLNMLDEIIQIKSSHNQEAPQQSTQMPPENNVSSKIEKDKQNKKSSKESTDTKIEKWAAMSERLNWESSGNIPENTSRENRSQSVSLLESRNSFFANRDAIEKLTPRTERSNSDDDIISTVPRSALF